MDVVFGKKSTPDELERAVAARPPKPLQLAFAIVMGVLFAAWLLSLVVRSGWLPIDREFIPTWGQLLIIGTLLIVQLTRDQVEGHYKRRADRDRITDGARDDHV